MGTISTPAKDQHILTPSERQQILVQWNDTAAEYPRDLCVHQLVARQAERTPSAPAVQYRSQILTYQDLNLRANQLACYLSQLGVGPDVPVGIFLNRSLDLAITLLAVLKSGGTCVPLDPQYPGERLAFMLEDAQVAVLVTDEDLLGKIDGVKGHTVCLSRDWNTIRRETNHIAAGKTAPENLAYIVYTSGSTGKPRGVQLPHRGLVNHHVAATKLYGLEPSDRVLQFSSISFDISIEEIFPTWVAGGTLVFRTEDTPLAASGFLRWIGEQRITVLNLPTAYWHELVHELSESSAASLPDSLRMVIVGGEKASSTAFASWLRVSRGKVRWVNTYGPTEASVIATAYEPQISDPEQVPASLPIGRPIANTQVYLLDSDLNPVPVGTEGELHIGGDGVARGYLNRPEMTAEKFIADPFSKHPGARLYKTGDLARYLPSGEIEFVGRRDFQVKIRGFRVELGEIEAVLATHPGIRDAVVVAKVDSSGDKRLVAYVVPANPTETETRQWRSFLEEQLPDYMVPSLFLTVEALPLTPNGKVDRRTLEERPVTQALIPRMRASVSSDPVEKQLIGIWQSVLGIQSVGLEDNFWELGGHSLLAARLTQLVENTFGKRLTLAAIIEAPTVQQLARIIKGEDKAQSWSCLLPLQPAGNKPPFFCIHGVGGNSVGFRDLANFVGSDQPFYGVQAQGLDGQLPCLTRVEDMAALYLREIRSIQPTGPYYLGGFSFGGWIACEMAQQLQAQREQIGLLAMFDTYPFRLKPVTSSLMSFFRIPSQQQLMYVLPKTIKKGIRRRIVWVGLPRAIKNVLRACYEAERQYQLRPYSGRVTLFRATQALTPDNDPHARWRDLARGGVEIQEIEGHHADIILEPQVRITAEKLRSCLERAQREYSASISDSQLSQVAD
jgi:amino acid adenylation domain-containing protein